MGKHTHSTATYLNGIRAVMNRQGYCRAVDLSREIGITPGSTSTWLKVMIKKGMIKYDQNKFILLTPISRVELKRFDDNKIKLTAMFEKYTPDQEMIERNVDKIYFLLDQCLIDYIVRK